MELFLFSSVIDYHKPKATTRGPDRYPDMPIDIPSWSRSYLRKIHPPNQGPGQNGQQCMVTKVTN